MKNRSQHSFRLVEVVGDVIPDNLGMVCVVSDSVQKALWEPGMGRDTVFVWASQFQERRNGRNCSAWLPDSVHRGIQVVPAG